MSSNDKNTKIKQEDTTNTISSSTTAAATTTSPTNTATNTTVSNNTSTTAATTTKSSTLPNQDKKPITTTSSSSSTSTTNTKNSNTGSNKNNNTTNNNNNNNNSNSNNGTNSNKSVSNKTQTDPNKMQDVLLSAGVDIREEEALLTGSVTATRNQAKSNSNTGGNTSHNSTTVPPHLPFLHPDQLSKFMKRVSKEHHFDHNYLKNLTKNNGEILNMVSTSCETYMRDIITNALIISRHRRRGVQLNTGRRSEVAIALKSIAQSQKKEEERRLKKRIALGLEKEDLENKVDSEETLHRASNVTAGLRAGSKKQYGWLTASVAKPTTSTIKSAGKIANEIAARGESGLRFREAREEPGIVMRDLLFALENRRNGVHNVITKGYARIRD